MIFITEFKKKKINITNAFITAISFIIPPSPYLTY